MTYADLAERIMHMTPEQLNQEVTVIDGFNDECYPVDHVLISDETCNILDIGCIVLSINY